MSLPLLPLDGEEPQQAPEKASAAPQPELKAEAEDAVSPEEHAETELPEPEATADKLHRMSAELTLRCVLGGILTVVLLHFGLVSDGLLPAMAALDPDAAPAAFYGCKPAAAGSKPVRGLPGAARRPERPARTVFFRDDAGAGRSGSAGAGGRQPC
ncbi:MAG: hypothetical protein ACLS4Y_03060 [Faecalibacterium sp.]